MNCEHSFVMTGYTGALYLGGNKNKNKPKGARINLRCSGCDGEFYRAMTNNEYKKLFKASVKQYEATYRSLKEVIAFNKYFFEDGEWAWTGEELMIKVSAYAKRHKRIKVIVSKDNDALISYLVFIPAFAPKQAKEYVVWYIRQNDIPTSFSLNSENTSSLQSLF